MINILSKDLIDKIAAGEVVERPASVVKELMENSIDAGADRIILKVENGGLDKISVEDNGIGIEKSDIPKIFHSHATSKIENIHDLSKISTFGFRGEALASLSSISNICLITRTKRDNEASMVLVKDSNITTQSASSNIGTIVEVEALFNNIPARRKFMKSEKTELSYILKIFQEIAISNPEKEFFMYNNNKEYAKYKKSDYDRRIKEIVKSDLCVFSPLYDSESISIKGSLIAPGALHSNGAGYIYVNNRIVNSAIIHKAIKEAYKSYLKRDLKPSYVLFIDISPELVDVNVHPRKTEVRFLNQGMIYNLMYNAVTKYFERINKSEDLEYSGNIVNVQIKDYPSYNKPLYNGENVYKTKDTRSSINFTKHLLAPSNTVLDEYSEFDNINFLQIDNKFIVFEYEGELNIIDQHGAAERINYEKYLDEFSKKKIEYISPLFPINIDLEKSKYLLVMDHLKEISNLGIEVEDLGNNIISIVRFSSLINKSRIEDVFNQLILDLEEETVDRRPDYYERIIASIACRSAIMFGQSLSNIEMRSLIKELYKCRTPFTCAHGRPIKYNIPFKDLLKKLARC